MTYPPDPGQQRPPGGHEYPPPADPFASPPQWEPPSRYDSSGPPPMRPGQPAGPPPEGQPGHGPPPGPPPGYGPPPAGPPPGYGPPSGPPPGYGPPPAGPPGYGPPGQPSGPPASGPPTPTSPFPSHVGPPTAYEAGSPPGPYGGASGPPGYGGPGDPTGSGPSRRRGLLIVGLVLAGVLVLCAGGGAGAFLLLRDTDRDGAESPMAASQAFLQAVYRDLDPARAADLVCSEARDQSALATKIDEISAYQDSYQEPNFTWSTPEVVEENDELTVVATTVTMVTADEKVSDLPLRVSVLDKNPHGWWVCNLETVAPPEEPTEGEDGDGPADEEPADGDGDGE